MHSDYNYYYDYTKKTDLVAQILSFADAPPQTTITHSNFSSWRTAPILSSGSETHSLFADPEIDTAGRPTGHKNPLLNNGTMILGLTDDYYKNRRDPSHIDIGAIQITGLAPSPAPFGKDINITTESRKIGWLQGKSISD